MTTIETISPSADGDTIRRADGWLLVLWYGDHRRGTWAYEPFVELNDAADAYEAYQRGEHHDFSPHALLACRNGVPFARLSAYRITDLMREARAA